MTRLQAMALTAIAAATPVGWPLPAAEPAEAERRAGLLARFFARKESPRLAALAPEFVAAADRHELDWRLLPALAAVETAAGRLARNNNPFGWGRRSYASFSDAIADVARQLAEAPDYRGKTTREKLVAYNRRHARRFPQRVERVMAEIGPL